jgi:AraC-like DNA-binding protein
MFEVVPYLSFFTFGLGLLFCLYLFLRFKSIPTTWFLVLLILCVCFTEFYMYALGSKLILKIPLLFRSAFPPRMLFGPLLFLYTSTMLFPEKKLKLVHFLHFLPSLIIIACLMPDYLAPNSYKLEVLNNFYQRNSVFILKPAGFIPSGFLPPIVISYGIGYCLASFWKIWKYKKSEMYLYLNNSIVVRWVSLFPLIMLIYLLGQFAQYFSLYLGEQINSYTQILQSIAILGVTAFLLINKDILENMDGCLNLHSSRCNQPLLPVPKDFSNAFFIDAIDRYILESKAYLEQQFTLNEMAKRLGYPSKKASILLSQTYGIHFNEWVNRHRIHYLMEMIKQKDFKNIKLEAVINQAGFQYRSSFYIAFKKIMNNTPSAYFKDLEKLI